ncbi:MAG: hypothetical protein SFX73_27015 [Kofleriaceae bacterium]|nr:hypothetical protein [Kofleriaceae bacterium]
MSPAVRRLLEGPIDSFEKLELLVMLERAPATSQAPGRLAAQLRLDVPVLEQILLGLERDGFVDRQPDGSVRLASLDRVAPLLRAYDDDNLSVLIQISTIAIGRIRGLAARTFADAFVLREKRRHDDG